jgi:hypothetical protein
MSGFFEYEVFVMRSMRLAQCLLRWGESQFLDGEMGVAGESGYSRTGSMEMRVALDESKRPQAPDLSPNREFIDKPKEENRTATERSEMDEHFNSDNESNGRR